MSTSSATNLRRHVVEVDGEGSAKRSCCARVHGLGHDLRGSGFCVNIDGCHNYDFYASSCVHACCIKVEVIVLDVMFVVMEEAASATSIESCNS
jgi:hypothetical protein